MFKTLQDFFNSRANSTRKASSDQELKLAAATLMFEMVRSDGKVERTELIAMGEVLREQFGLAEADLAEMLELAKNRSEEATCLQGFTREICDNWGNAKRVKLLEHLWSIALADKTVDSHERHLVRKIAGLLYLNEMQIVSAKENAKTRLGIKDFQN